MSVHTQGFMCATRCGAKQFGNYLTTPVKAIKEKKTKQNNRNSDCPLSRFTALFPSSLSLPVLRYSLFCSFFYFLAPHILALLTFTLITQTVFLSVGQKKLISGFSHLFIRATAGPSHRIQGVF